MPTETIDQRIDRLRGIVEEGERAAAELAELQELKRLMAKYDVSPPQATSRVAAPVAENIAHNSTLSRALTTKDKIILGAESVLQDGQRRLSRRLLADMEKIGVIVDGKDPVANLSSYLSREKDRFESDLKLGGWTLKRLTKKARPESVGALPGLSINDLTGGALGTLSLLRKEDTELG